MYFSFSRKTRRRKHVQFWEETEHYCLRYSVPKLDIIAIFRHLISYNINLQLQHELYVFQIIQHIKEAFCAFEIIGSNIFFM